MKRIVLAVVAYLSTTASFAADSPLIPVTVDNFIRAETDLSMKVYVNDGAMGTFTHARLPTPIDKQKIVRMNPDTLYSFAVFDLDAGDVTITLPEVGKRYIMMQVIHQDHCSAALYLTGHSKNNDGKHIETLTLKDVPVDGFWSISVYNKQGFFVKNAANTYSINNLTAKPDKNGSIIIQFGGCNEKIINCLPIMNGGITQYAFIVQEQKF